MLDGLGSTVALMVKQAAAQETLREERDYIQSIIHSMADMLMVVARMAQSSPSTRQPASPWVIWNES